MFIRAVRFAFTPIAIMMLILTLPSGCRKDQDEAHEPVYADAPAEGIQPVYIFSTHPLFSEQRVFELFTPIINCLNSSANGFRFKLETAPDYETYEIRLREGRYHFSLPNPLETVKAADTGYTIFGKVADDEQFRGIILAPINSAYTRVTDLRGKKISYPSLTALAACMLPQYFFTTHGLNVQHDVTSIFTGNQESSIMSAVTGMTDVAVTWPPPWELFQSMHPEDAATLKVLWETPELVNNGLVVRNDVPEPVLSHVKQILFDLANEPDGKRMLEAMNYSGFEPANERTFDQVREFLQKFSDRVRPL